MNKKTSARIQQWLQSIEKKTREITKRVQHRHKENRDISITEFQLNLSQSTQDQLIKHLNHKSF
jgi:hypothetical protein